MAECFCGALSVNLTLLCLHVLCKTVFVKVEEARLIVKAHYRDRWTDSLFQAEKSQTDKL